MAIFFYITEGEMHGRAFNIKNGLTIGRADKNISLFDEKVSGLHAIVQKDKAGKYYLVDQQSRNGIKVKRKKVKKLLLKPGVEFILGKTVILVKSGRASPPRAKEVRVKELSLEKNWSEHLIEHGTDIAKKLKNNPISLTAFNPPLKLYFYRGIQVETEWVLGYGPRRVGPGAMDLPLFESRLPELCFELHPHKEGSMFKTNFSKNILLNGKAVAKSILKDGDVISLKSTYIKVSYSNE